MGKNKKKELRDLVCDVYRDTRTVELMDEFEGYAENSIPYDRLIINGFTGFTKIGLIRCKYIIIRMKSDEETVGDVTFTKLKTGNCNKLTQYIREQVETKLKDWDKNKIEIKLDKPYLLRAQNSYNREGYGWEWDWTDGLGTYVEGTEYGETTKYGIVGVIVSEYP